MSLTDDEKQFIADNIKERSAAVLDE